MGTLATFALLLAALVHRSSGEVAVVDVGLLGDSTDVVPSRSAAAVTMGLEEFYKKHPGYSTRVRVHSRDSGEGAVGAASAALGLIKNVKVQAILGPSGSEHAKFVIHLGNRTQVPIITFSATSPSLSPTYSPYFARMALNSSCQVDAIASIVKSFEWRQVVPVYEDAEYGRAFLPYLLDALQDVNAQVPYRGAISPFATDSNITDELSKLMSMQTRVFTAHLLPPLSSRFFMKAKEMGMMSEGYVWIITQGLTDVLDTIDPEVLASMHGVLGLKPYVPYSAKLENFTAHWRDQFIQKTFNVSGSKPSIFNLWAYDASWALAIAVEKAHGVQPAFKSAKTSDGPTDLDDLGISLMGPRIMQSILNTNFTGISGKFHLINGQLQYSAFQIINLNASGLREVGFWTQANGVTQNLPSTTDNNMVQGLKPIIWPGYVIHKPKGWELLTPRKVLHAAVPAKSVFMEFVNAEKGHVTGYCIDVFDAVINSLPYPVHVKYEPYDFAQDPDSYDNLANGVFFKRFDAVVGDITILASRSLNVDFTLPYTESGISMVVPVKGDRDKSVWVFLKPFTLSLWLASLASIFGTGFVIWVIEHRINDDFRGPPMQQLGIIFYFVFSTMVFAHKEKLVSNWSKLVVTFWIFFMLILTSSYTSSLASMLTAQQLQPSVSSINDLLRNGDSVGYPDGSFVRTFLEELKFSPSSLRNYSSLVAYEESLSRGSKNGGVSAIIDEIPYLKLFLKNRCCKYVMIGPIHRTTGFGFVFPKGSPLVPDVSRAILNITQGKMMEDIEKKWFGDQTGCSTERDIYKSNRLELSSFWGLFLITGCFSILAIFIFSCTFLQNNWDELKTRMASEATLSQKLSMIKECFDSWDVNAHAPKKPAESVNTYEHDMGSSRTSINLHPMTPTINGSRTPSVLDPAEGSHSFIDPDVPVVPVQPPPPMPRRAIDVGPEE